jgi:L-threonylcarbamoyladenylate synthase
MKDMEQDVEACLKTLREGGLILYPTDTIWGIGCDATNEDAVAKVYALKKRPDAKSLIVLMADERDVLRHVASADLAVFDFLKTTDKPTTVIYEGGIGFAANLLPADGSIAIRICHDDFCRQLIRRFRKPIVSTSANISGEASPAHFGEVSAAIQRGVDYVVSHRQDDRSPAQPSSIIRWRNGQPEWIRR